MHLGTVAEYSDLTVLSGEYTDTVIFVAHGCPTLSRKEYAEGSGDLESFEVGDYHELYLTTQNIRNIEYIFGAESLKKPLYFCRVVNLYSKEPAYSPSAKGAQLMIQ